MKLMPLDVQNDKFAAKLSPRTVPMLSESR
jgi:hypothetical protein